MKLFALGIFAVMVALTIGFANSSDEMLEADRRDAEYLAAEEAKEQAARAAAMASVGLPAVRRQ